MLIAMPGFLPEVRTYHSVKGRELHLQTNYRSRVGNAFDFPRSAIADKGMSSHVILQGRYNIAGFIRCIDPAGLFSSRRTTVKMLKSTYFAALTAFLTVSALSLPQIPEQQVFRFGKNDNAIMNGHKLNINSTVKLSSGYEASHCLDQEE